MSDKLNRIRAQNQNQPAPVQHHLQPGFSKYYRIIWAGIAVICFASMGYALYAEHILGLEPCNLCMLQRGSMSLLGIIALIAFIHSPKNKILNLIYIILAEVAALSGIILASRHVWLQHLPAEKVPACGPPFDYLVSQFPITEVIQEIFSGSGDCAEIKWQFIGLSMPEWLLAIFIGLFIVCQIQLFNWIKQKQSK